MEGIKKVEGVLGAIYATGQVQIVLGKELIPVYTAVSEIYDAAGGGDAFKDTPSNFPAFGQSDTYVILGWVANAPFYFMPIFVAYGAAKQLNSTPIYAMAGVSSLLTPAFTEMVASGEAITMQGIPVRLVKYQQQLLPALLIAVACCYIEKWLSKHVPGIFKSIFVGMGAMGLSMVLGFTILGPLGSYVGSAI